jgi:hypothetical protein
VVGVDEPCIHCSKNIPLLLRQNRKGRAADRSYVLLGPITSPEKRGESAPRTASPESRPPTERAPATPRDFEREFERLTYESLVADYVLARRYVASFLSRFAEHREDFESAGGVGLLWAISPYALAQARSRVGRSNRSSVRFRLRAIAIEGLPSLDARERYVLTHQFGLDREPERSLRVTAERLGPSREGVRLTRQEGAYQSEAPHRGHGLSASPEPKGGHMTNDRQEPANRPGTTRESREWDANSWIVVDDLAGTGVGGDKWNGSWGAASGAAPEPKVVAPREGGWDGFAQGRTWNGMPVAPPGSGPGAAPPEVPRIWTDTRPSGPWGDPGGEVRDGERSGAGGADDAESAWFFEEAPQDNRFQDGIGDHGVRGPAAVHRGVALRTRAGRMDAGLGAASVTFLVTCLGVLLVVLSTIWHPQVP